MPIDVESLLQSLGSLPAKTQTPGMSDADRLNDIASKQHLLNDMNLPTDTRQGIANDIIQHHREMGAQLPTFLQNYDPNKSMDEQIPRPPDPSSPVRLGDTNKTVPARPWQPPLQPAQPLRPLKRVLIPQVTPQQQMLQQATDLIKQHIEGMTGKTLAPEEGSAGGMKVNPLDALKIDPEKLLE